MAARKHFFLTVFAGIFFEIQAQEFCRDMNYWCKEGHCCGRGKCCTYYYELWWFWFVWLAIAVTGICCFYQKKVKQPSFLQRLMGVCRTPSPPAEGGGTSGTQSTAEPQADTSQPQLDPDKVFHLPSYEESRNMSKDPPSYTQVFGADGQLPQTSVLSPSMQTPVIASVPPGGPPLYSLEGNGGSQSDTLQPEDSPPQYSASAQPAASPEASIQGVRPCLADSVEGTSPRRMMPPSRGVDSSVKAGLLENEEVLDCSFQ